MTFTVLGFMGRSQSGKDLCGSYLAAKHDFVPVALADPLKRFAKAVFPFDPETHLWGVSDYRNTPVPVDWVQAEKALHEHMDNWVSTLALSIPERASYRNILREWFNACKKHSKDNELSARIALQLLGTEYGRAFKDTIWVDYFYEKIVVPIQRGAAYHPWYGVTGAEDKNNKGVIITDLRFINELNGVKDNGGKVIFLRRLSLEGRESDSDKAGLPKHQSEAELQAIPSDQFDVVLETEEGIEGVHKKLDLIMEEQGWGRT